MPTFYADDIDISPDEFLSHCTSADIRTLIQALTEDGHLDKGLNINRWNGYGGGVSYTEYIDSVKKLASSYYSMNQSDIDTINKMASKY